MINNLLSIQKEALLSLEQNALLNYSINLKDSLLYITQLCYPSTQYKSYNERPELIIQLHELPEKLSVPFDELVKLLILKLITKFSVHRIDLIIPIDITNNYERSIQRIYKQWTIEPTTKLNKVDDLLLKDIGLLTGALLPCAERVVEPFSAIQRSLAFTNGITQGIRFIKLLIAAKGNKPVCRLHVHLSEINDLSAANWQVTCLQIAQLLKLNPRLKGVVGASWFYDPEIASYSSKLAFIKQQLKEINASWFFSHNEGQQSCALNRSPTRRKAFASGHYTPKNYIVFIPKNNLINWLNQQTRK